MAEEKQASQALTGKFYTSSRSFKQVIGAFPDGTKIWGGPYTIDQFVVMLIAMMLGWSTRQMWGSDSALGDFITLVIVAYGVGYLVGKLPRTRRKVLGLLSSTTGLLTHPGAGGKHKGRPLRLSRKAQSIQRRNKKTVKEDQQEQPQNEPELEANLSPGGVTPVVYGSSLNRLLAKHGLLETEGKH